MFSKPVQFLWFGQTMANLGDILYIVAIISLLYQATESALFTSMVPLLFVGAQLVSGILAPLLFDRYELKPILVVSQTLKTTLLLLITAYFRWFTGDAWVSLAFVFVFAIALLDGVATPARNAWLPRLADPQQLIKTNSLFASTDQAVQFIGWAFGGILVSVSGEANVLWGACGLYVLTILLLLVIPSGIQEVAAKPSQSNSNWESIKEGWTYMWQTPLLRILTWSEVLEGLAGGVWISAILLVYVKEALSQGEQWWGFLNASYFIGMILGGLMMLALGNHIQSKVWGFLALSNLLAVILTWGFGYTTWSWLAIGLSVALGPVHQIQQVIKQTLIQKESPLQILAKVLTARGTLQYVAFGVSVYLMSAVTDHWGVRIAYFLSAGLLGLQLIYLLYHRHFLRSLHPEHHDKPQRSI